MTLDLRTVSGMAGLICVVILAGCQTRVDGRTGATRCASAEPTKPLTPDRVRLELAGPGVTRPQTYTLTQLAEMEQTKLDDVLLSKSHSPNERTSWRGPALQLLLDDAGLKPGPVELKLEAGDGYRTICSLAEAHSAIVAIQDGDGRWLHEVDAQCPLRFVPPELPGNYWVLNIVRITVLPSAAPGTGT